jgi:hypothetical protein
MTTDQTPLIERFCKAFNLTLEVPEPHHWVIDQFQLYAPEHEEVTGVGDDTCWEVLAVTVRPGRRYLPNGDPGYPDDVDVKLVGKHTTVFGALEKIAERVVQAWVDIEQTAADEQRLQAEDEASMLMHAKLHDEHPDEYES